MKFAVFIGIMSKKWHIKTRVKAGNNDEVRSFQVHGLVKKVKTVYLENEVIPSAGYFKELELFNNKSTPNELIFVAVKKRATNECEFSPRGDLEPAI